MKRLYDIVVLMAMMLSLTACNGVLDGIYDDAVGDDAIKDGFSDGMEDAKRFTLTLDTRSYMHWYYIDLEEKTIDTVEVAHALTGEWDGKSQWVYYNVQGTNYTKLQTVNVDTQREPDKWDIAIHHFDVKTNNGAVWETPYTTIEQVPEDVKAFEDVVFTPDEWRDNLCIVDLSTMMSYNVWYTGSMVNRVMSRWVKMDFSTPPPVYTASDKVYVLRKRNGSYVAIRLISYMSDRGTKGYLTVEVKKLGC